jgi:hypothetical protein
MIEKKNTHIDAINIALFALGPGDESLQNEAGRSILKVNLCLFLYLLQSQQSKFFSQLHASKQHLTYRSRFHAAGKPLRIA